MRFGLLDRNGDTVLSTSSHHRGKSVDYEALSVASSAPRWLKTMTKHGFMPKPQAA